jgi:hypothetical protein
MEQRACGPRGEGDPRGIGAINSGPGVGIPALSESVADRLLDALLRIGQAGRNSTCVLRNAASVFTMR